MGLLPRTASADARKALAAAQRDQLTTVAPLVMPHGFGGVDPEMSTALDLFRAAGWEHYDTAPATQGRLVLFFRRPPAA